MDKNAEIMFTYYNFTCTNYGWIRHRQDEANPVFYSQVVGSLPQWGKMGPYHPLGISCVGPAIKSSLCGHNNKSLFDQACSVKMAR